MVRILAIVAVAVGMVALLRYWRRWFRGVIAAQLAAHQRGDYEGQLRAVEPLKVWQPDAYLFYRGSGLFALGRLQEAEACLRRSLAMRQGRRLRAVRESQLGRVLLEQQRYAEAIAAFESSIAGWPKRAGGHRGIAQTLLRQGAQPAEALRQARRAADIAELDTALGSEFRDLSVGEALGTLAWAEAVNSGAVSEVEHLLSKAFALCPQTSVPVRAELHYHAGRAYAALGKTEESAKEMERAASLDPKGNYGRLAKADRLEGVGAAYLAAHRRGDYEGAMRAAEGLRAWEQEGYLFCRGSGLFHLGRLQEAEACLRQSLPMWKERRARAVSESKLGYVLLEQQRYSEAIACFKSSIADWPQYGSGHRGIAETLLRQGVQAAEALRQARQAAGLDEVNAARGAEAHDLDLSESLAAIAWAEAVNAGAAAEVERLLSGAFALCPETTVPTRAELHYHAGRAYAALGQTEESAREFQRAASLDPQGNYGRLAKAAMA